MKKLLYITAFLIIIGIIGFFIFENYNFSYVLNGTIDLNQQEIESVKKLITDAGILPKKLPVFIKKEKYDQSYLANQILIENGHVIALRINSSPLKEMDSVSEFKEIRILDFSNNQIEKINGLLELKKLEELTLMGNKIKDPSGIENCIALKRLRISANQFEDTPDTSKLSNLEYLFLGNNKINSLKNLKGGEKLKFLDFALNNLTSLKELPELPNLYTLNLSENQLTTLEGIPPLPNLRELILNDNYLESVDELVGPSYPRLVSLNLKNNRIKKLPEFGGKISKVKTEGNLIPKPVKKEATPPSETRVLKPGRVLALPEINGKFYGGGMYHTKSTGPSVRIGTTTPKTFRFAQEDKTLEGISGFNIMLGSNYDVNEAKVTITVEKGRVRVYLKHAGDSVWVEDERYGKIPKTKPNDEFVYKDAEPGKPCSIEGLTLSPKFAKYDIILEALDGKAEGVSYEATEIGS